MQLQRVLQDLDDFLELEDELLERLCSALGLDKHGDVPLPPELASLSLTELAQYVYRRTGGGTAWSRMH